MTHLLASHPIATWLENRMAQLDPLPEDRVRLVGLVVVDPQLVDPDTAARASWIGDGSSVREVVERCAADLERFDVVAAVVWPGRRPSVSIVIVNP